MDRTTDHDEHAANVRSGVTNSKRDLGNMMELIECMPTASHHNNVWYRDKKFVASWEKKG